MYKQVNKNACVSYVRDWSLLFKNDYLTFKNVFVSLLKSLTVAGG